MIKKIEIDTLIIGAGISGHLASYFLSKKGFDYLIIESGSDKNQFLYSVYNNISNFARNVCGVGVGGGYNFWGRGLVNPSAQDKVNVDWKTAKSALTFFNGGKTPIYIDDIKETFKFDLKSTPQKLKMTTIPIRGKHLDVFDNFDTEKYIKNKTIHSFQIKNICTKKLEVIGIANGQKYIISPKRILCCAGGLGTPEVISNFDINKNKKIEVLCNDHYLGSFASLPKDSKVEISDYADEDTRFMFAYTGKNNKNYFSMFIQNEIKPFRNHNYLQNIIEMGAFRGKKRFWLMFKIGLMQPFKTIKFFYDLFFGKNKIIFLDGASEKTGIKFSVKNGKKISKIQWNSGLNKKNKDMILSKSPDKNAEIINSEFITASHPHNTKMNGIKIADMKMPKNFYCIDNARLPRLRVSNTTLTNLYMLYKDMINIYENKKYDKSKNN